MSRQVDREENKFTLHLFPDLLLDNGRRETGDFSVQDRSGVGSVIGGAGGGLSSLRFHRGCPTGGRKIPGGVPSLWIRFGSVINITFYRLIVHL